MRSLLFSDTHTHPSLPAVASRKPGGGGGGLQQYDSKLQFLLIIKSLSWQKKLDWGKGRGMGFPLRHPLLGPLHMTQYANKFII